MSRDKENSLSKLMATLARYMPRIERQEFPPARLDNARMALDGASVPLPNNAGPLLPTGLMHIIHSVALATDGTIAVVGRYHGKDDKDVLLVAEPESTRFVEIDKEEIIERLFFPEGSNQPAYLRVRDHSRNEDEWVWNIWPDELNLLADRNDRDTRPLFWMRDGEPRGAVIKKNTLYAHEAGVDEDRNTRLYKSGFLPVHLQIIADKLLAVWRRENESCVILWNGLERQVTTFDLCSITEGPDGTPRFLLPDIRGFSLNDMTSGVRELGYQPEGIWTAPGQIFTLEEVSTSPPDGPSSRIHEVISGWSSEVLEDTQVEQLWPVALAGRMAAIYDYRSRTMRIINQAGQAGSDVANSGEIGPLPERTGVTKLGSTFVSQDDNHFGFLLDGRTQFAAHRIPRQGLRLEHLVLMDNGTIQAVAKVGTAVLTYKFFAPK